MPAQWPAAACPRAPAARTALEPALAPGLAMTAGRESGALAGCWRAAAATRRHCYELDQPPAPQPARPPPDPRCTRPAAPGQALHLREKKKQFLLLGSHHRLFYLKCATSRNRLSQYTGRLNGQLLVQHSSQAAISVYQLGICMIRVMPAQAPDRVSARRWQERGREARRRVG